MPTVSVKFRKEDNSEEFDESKSRKIEAKEGDILFEALDDQGITLPHGCLSGSCGSCRVEVLEGNDNLADPSYIEKDTVDHITGTYKIDLKKLMEGRIVRLSCRAKILGDVTITPLKEEKITEKKSDKLKKIT